MPAQRLIKWQKGFKDFTSYYDFLFWFIVIAIFLFSLNRMIPAPRVLIYIYWICVIFTGLLTFFKIAWRTN